MGLTASGENVTGLIGKQTAPQDLGYPAGAYVVPKGEEFADDATALIESGWLTNINSTDGIRWRVLPLQWDIEPTKEDDIYATSTTGNIAFVRAGKTTVKYSVKVTPFVMTQLNNMNGIEWDIYILTSNGFIIGTTEDGTKFQPFTLQNFHVEGEIGATGTDPSSVPITWTYDDPDEWNKRASFIEPLKSGTPATWNARDLKDPKAVLSVVTNQDTSGFDIALAGYDDVPFTGAAKEDVVIEDTTTGVLTALDSLTESGTVPGQYAAVATIPAETYYIGPAPVGTASATQGFAGLRSDLIKNEYIVA